jgi:outer membrane immunogenic protein
MKRTFTAAASALALISGLAATQASAQGLRGVRVEGQVGYSQFSANGEEDNHIGYGGAAGVDFDLGGFVLGAEGTFWWAPAETEGADGPGFAEHKTFEELGIAARAGVMASPSTLVYGKIGYVRNEQRKRFTPFNPGTTVPNSARPGAYYENYKVNGWQYGAGVEQMISNNVYAKVEGRYSDYEKEEGIAGGTHTITGLVGLGVLFGGARAEEPVVIAPAPVVVTPPPAAPATQTCPDGSVILATDVCPAPPPPPPPPAPAPERG